MMLLSVIKVNEAAELPSTAASLGGRRMEVETLTPVGKGSSSVVVMIEVCLEQSSTGAMPGTTLNSAHPEQAQRNVL